VFADPSDAAISAKAVNPNAARFLIDYLCSAEGQKKVAERWYSRQVSTQPLKAPTGS